MKSWKNRRNTFWIILATVFGIVLPGNQFNNYINLRGLVWCWIVYLIFFVIHNKEVQRDEEKYNQAVLRQKEEIRKKEEQEKKKEEERNQTLKELTYYPIIIRNLLIKYRREWESNKYPIDALMHINTLKTKRDNNIELEEKDIERYKAKIEYYKNKKGISNIGDEQKIEAYKNRIEMCKRCIDRYKEAYKKDVVFYQEQIDRYKDQCRKQEKEANELLETKPVDVIEAIDWRMKCIKETEEELQKAEGYKAKNIKRTLEEFNEEIPYLHQAKLDAIEKITRNTGAI